MFAIISRTLRRILLNDHDLVVRLLVQILLFALKWVCVCYQDSFHRIADFSTTVLYIFVLLFQVISDNYYLYTLSFKKTH